MLGGFLLLLQNVFGGSVSVNPVAYLSSASVEPQYIAIVQVS